MPPFATHSPPGSRMTVALVNNMPDSAFLETEKQFRVAVGAGPAGAGVRLDLYTITEIPRSEPVAAEIRARYAGLNELWQQRPDALIVTGTEPAQVQLPYEPYWPYLARLLEWAAGSVPTALLSCLAAHASVLLFDGIERRPRAVRCSGIYPGVVAEPRDPLANGLPDVVPVPHSRVNDVAETDLIRAGYRIVIGSGDSGLGWSVAARTCGESEFVLCQGHPEYATLSLLREYRRDVRRCLFGRGAVAYPALPEGYLSPDGLARLRAFAQRAAAPGQDPRALWSDFPYAEVAAGVQNTWTAPGATLYANWLGLARRAQPTGA